MAESAALNEAMLQVKAMTEAGPASGGIKPEATGFGRFEGIPAKVELSTEDRSGTLLEAIAYTSEAGDAWPVPAGAWLDGASIPRAFWTIIGDPYGPGYREPSIVHDHYCIIRTRAWRDTHRMFHEAMLCRDVGSLKARVMFYAVYRFGPRWQVGGVTPESATIEPDDNDALSILRDARAICEGDLGVGAIEALVDGGAATAGRR